MIDFAPLHARISWASGNIDRLRRVVSAYVALPPYRETTRRGPGSQTVVRAELIRDPPIEISLALSDALHQLRATLDNLVGALREGGPSRRSAFPITADPDRFAELANSSLAGVPQWAVDEIRRHQPFPENELWWIGAEFQALHELARRDRHRALALQATVVEASHVEVQMQDQEMPIQFRQDGPRAAEVVYGGRTEARAVFQASVVLAEPIGPHAGDELVAIVDGMYQRVSYLVALMEEQAGRRAR
jgi:hypothetical protein